MTTTPRRIWRNRDRIEIREAELIQHLTQCPRGSFGKIHLSNLPDWMDQDQCGTVLTLARQLRYRLRCFTYASTPAAIGYGPPVR